LASARLVVLHGGQSDEHHETDLSQDVVVHSRPAVFYMIRVVPSGDPRERGFRNRLPNAAMSYKRATGRQLC